LRRQEYRRDPNEKKRDQFWGQGTSERFQFSSGSSSKQVWRILGDGLPLLLQLLCVCVCVCVCVCDTETERERQRQRQRDRKTWQRPTQNKSSCGILKVKARKGADGLGVPILDTASNCDLPTSPQLRPYSSPVDKEPAVHGL
jgi:hypothetical protein